MSEETTGEDTPLEEESIPSPADNPENGDVKPAFGGFTGGTNKDGSPTRKRGRPPGSRNKAGGSSEKPRAPRAPSSTNLKKSLQDTFTLIGVGVTAVNQYDGAVILKNAEGLAKSLDHLANENPSVKRALESMLVASAWGAVLTSCAAISVPVAANHGLLPPHMAMLFGCPPPDIEGFGRVVT